LAARGAALVEIFEDPNRQIAADAGAVIEGDGGEGAFRFGT
jgi:hypothetical protein